MILFMFMIDVDTLEELNSAGYLLPSFCFMIKLCSKKDPGNDLLASRHLHQYTPSLLTPRQHQPVGEALSPSTASSTLTL